ncbi:unannotated protein [freshwater metagenome]|uniref:Unannotated protein n=1 Tax=freshwater metagenome TaxID=449393 RepID=A0A6J6PFV9_9ZZZZ
MRILFAWDPDELDQLIGVNSARKFCELAHIWMFDLPTSRHLLNNQLGIHPHFNVRFGIDGMCRGKTGN